MDFKLPPPLQELKQPISDAARKLVRDFKVLALTLTNSDAVVFTPKDCDALMEVIDQNPDVAREDWIAAAKALIEPMEREFEFKRCGQTLAQMLEAKVIAVQQKREREAKRQREEEAAKKANEDYLAKRRAEIFSDADEE